MSYLNGEINVWPEIGAVFFDLLILFAAYHERTALSRSNRFFALVCAVLVATLVDIPASIVLGYGIPIPRAMMTVLIFLCYACSGVAGYTACYYVESFAPEKTVRRMRIINRAVLGLFFLLLVCNATVLPGIVRGFDFAALRAYRGPLFLPVAYGVPLYFLIYSEILILPGMENSLTLSGRRAVYVMYAMVLGGYLLQFFSGGLKFSYTFMSFAVYILYLGVETPEYRRLKSTLEQLREAELSAEKANSAKTDFLAAMSHDIRTPINAMLGFNEMILRDSREPSVQAYAKDMRRAGVNLMETVNTVLDYSKIQAGKLVILPVSYELNRLIERLKETYAPLLAEKDIAFIIDADGQIPNRLTGDEARLRQVLENLLSNAEKFTEHGSVTLRVHLEERRGTSVRILFSVRDTGSGIRRDEIELLRQAFRRLGDADTMTMRGTGLGLNIVESVLHMMGATLQIDSTYGKGSIFSFVIEQEAEGEETLKTSGLNLDVTKPVEPAVQTHVRAPDARILVIDDTQMNLTVVKGLLKETGARIDTALSGEEGIALCGANHYDLLFIDHRMPGKDGVETLQEIRRMEVYAQTPCIAMTGEAEAGAKERYLAYGFTDYIAKPVRGSELLHLLSLWLPEGKRKEQDADSDQ